MQKITVLLLLLLLLQLLPFRRYRFFYCHGDTNGVRSSLVLLVGMDSLHYNTARTNNSRCCYRFDGNRVLLLSATKEEDEVEDDHDTDDPRTIVGLLLLLPSRRYRFCFPVF